MNNEQNISNMTNEAKNFQWGEGSVQELSNGTFRYVFRKVTRTGRVGNSDYLIHSGIAKTLQGAWDFCLIHNKPAFVSGKQNKNWK